MKPFSAFISTAIILVCLILSFELKITPALIFCIAPLALFFFAGAIGTFDRKGGN